MGGRCVELRVGRRVLPRLRAVPPWEEAAGQQPRQRQRQLECFEIRQLGEARESGKIASLELLSAPKLRLEVLGIPLALVRTERILGGVLWRRHRGEAMVSADERLELRCEGETEGAEAAVDAALITQGEGGPPSLNV